MGAPYPGILIPSSKRVGKSLVDTMDTVGATQLLVSHGANAMAVTGEGWPAHTA